MNHLDIVKRALNITWRYRPLWLFGFLLALCSGGGGGSRSFNGNFPSSSPGDDFSQFGGMQPPEIDPGLIIALIIAVFCLVVVLAVVGVVIQVISRTALIGMVSQISETEAVTVADGWRLGWSRQAWRLFLVGLVIGIPWFIVTLFLVLLAFAPLLLLFVGDTVLTIVAIAATVIAFLFVVLILIILGVILSLFLDLARRRVVLEERGVIDSIGDTIGILRQRTKDIIIIWLIMLGAGFAWAVVSILIVLPISLIAAALVGIVPAALVYFISDSVIAALVAGAPMALLVVILVSAAAGGLYLIFRSAVWTLTYLDVRGPNEPGDGLTNQPVDPASDAMISDASTTS